MDKNRKILVSIFAFVILSLLLSLFQIYFTMDNRAARAGGMGLSNNSGIGIVRITGAISMSGDRGTFGIPAGADAIVQQLDKLDRDDRIKAIVVRVDSPGGTVAATQEIFAKITKIRGRNKPLVASMGDMAASGGYYSAAACNYIMANSGTLTGSIGVIMAAPNLKGLFEKLGIKMTVIKSGQYKDILSSSREISPEESKLLQDMIDRDYQQFLKDVSLGRNIPIDDIRPWADGRVMLGSEALEHKLIDGLGTFDDACAKARELAKLPADAPLYEDTRTPLQQLLGTVESAAPKNPIESMVRPSPYSMIEYRYQP